MDCKVSNDYIADRKVGKDYLWFDSSNTATYRYAVLKAEDLVGTNPFGRQGKTVISQKRLL